MYRLWYRFASTLFRQSDLLALPASDGVIASYVRSPNWTMWHAGIEPAWLYRPVHFATPYHRNGLGGKTLCLRFLTFWHNTIITHNLRVDVHSLSTLCLLTSHGYQSAICWQTHTMRLLTQYSILLYYIQNQQSTILRRSVA